MHKIAGTCRHGRLIPTLIMATGQIQWPPVYAASPERDCKHCGRIQYKDISRNVTQGKSTSQDATFGRLKTHNQCKPRSSLRGQIVKSFDSKFKQGLAAAKFNNTPSAGPLSKLHRAARGWQWLLWQTSKSLGKSSTATCSLCHIPCCQSSDLPHTIRLNSAFNILAAIYAQPA